MVGECISNLQTQKRNGSQVNKQTQNYTHSIHTFQGGYVYNRSFLSEKLHSRTGKISQLMKYLPHKHKDLSRSPVPT